MPFRVAFTRRANQDVSEKEAWLTRLGSTAVARWRTRLLRAVERLETDPEYHPLADEAADLGLDLRQLLFGRRRHVYRVLFTVEPQDQTVTVHHIRHAAQDRLAPDDF